MVASVTFYANASLNYLVLLLIMTAITYSASHASAATDDARYKRLMLMLGLSNLLVLGYFKYMGFLVASLPGQFDFVTHVVLPFGISYYTFNLISYSLDVHNRRFEPPDSWLDFATYATFFPTIGSGPLIRFREFNQQDQSTLKSSHLQQGLYYFVIGLAKKLIIADTIGTAIDPFFATYADLQFWTAWIVVLGYTYQLYFDFSGYTDMAMGAGYLLGFKLPQNFNAPYASRNITEFWQRWHITLSHWFRDYLFFPLSRTLLRRNDRKNPDRIRTISLIVTMTLVGLWHGANWTFVVWGAYHGVMLAVHAQTRANQGRAWPEIPARALTFILVVIGLALFRSTSLPMAAKILAAMFGLNGFESTPTAEVPIQAILFGGVLFVITNLEQDTWNLQPQPGFVFALGTAILLVTCLLILDQTTPFLYVQF